MLTTLLLTLTFQNNPLHEAKEATHNKDYQHSIQLLNTFQPNKEQYNEYCFYMATNYYALNDKQNTQKWTHNLLNSFNSIPNRYKYIAEMMEDDTKTWKPGDLHDIKRDMTKSANNLETARAGTQTQQIQKDIITKLDKLIKEQEDQANNKGKEGKDKDGKSTPVQGQGNPAQDSTPMGGNGKGNITEKKLQKLAEEWGKLPPKERAQAMQEIYKELPPKFKPMIEDYFRSLNKMEDKKP